jgi:DNA-binding beta-propeller fold protein YncE
VLGQFGTGSPGGGDSALRWPTSVTILPDGAVAIADAANTRMVVVSSPRTYLGSVGVGPVKQPGGLAVASDGSYFISDTAADHIVHLDKEGHVLATFGSRGFGQGQFFQPLGLDIGPDGNLYVADSGNNRIEVVTQSGRFVRHIGRQGHDPGQFVGPHAVSVADGTLWVADTGNARIQHLTLGGGVLGISVAGVNGAWGVAADGTGGVYYSAHWGQRVFHWIKDGQQTRWGAPGSGADEVDHPGALAATSSEQTIYVVDEGNSRIQIVANGLTAGQRGGRNSSAAGLTEPVAVALTPDGSIAVLDAARQRIVRYLGGSAGRFQPYVQKGLSLGVSAVAADRAFLTVADPWTGFTTVASVTLGKTT